MKKKIVAIVAIIALIAVLGVVLCACNKDDYTKRLDKAGYKYVVQDGKIAEIAGCEWMIEATNGEEFVTIAKFLDADKAKEAYNDAKEEFGDEGKVVKHGKVIVAGTKAGVKAAE